MPTNPNPTTPTTPAAKPVKRVPSLVITKRDLAKKGNGFLLSLTLSVTDQNGLPFDKKMVTLKDGATEVTKGLSDPHGLVVLDHLFLLSYANSSKNFTLYVEGSIIGYPVTVNFDPLPSTVKSTGHLDIMQVYADPLTGNHYIKVRVSEKNGNVIGDKVCVIMYREHTIETQKTSVNGVISFEIPAADGPRTHNEEVQVVIMVDGILEPVEEILFIPPVINTANNIRALIFLGSMIIAWIISLAVMRIFGINTATGIIFLLAAAWSAFTPWYFLWSLRDEVAYAAKEMARYVRQKTGRHARDSYFEDMVNFFKKNKESVVVSAQNAPVHIHDTFAQRLAAEVSGEAIWKGLTVFFQRLRG